MKKVASNRRFCWKRICRLVLVAGAFPWALVSVWRANIVSLTESNDDPPRLAARDRFAVRRHRAPSRANEVLLPRPPVHTRGDAPAQRNNNKSNSNASSVGAAATASPVRDAVPSSPSSSHSPYAYVFLIGYCDPDKVTYKRYVAGVSVAAYLLRKYGSRQDMVLYIMMSETSMRTTLPLEDFRVFDALNVTVRQIPTARQQTYHRLQLQKFRALGLAQYRRVLFLDCDVMPLANLDVLFELSDPNVHDPPMLKENVVFVDYAVPANGGIWMVAPRVGDLAHVNGLIRDAQLLRNQGVDGKEPWRDFPPHPWEAIRDRGDAYHYFAVSGDQGLLYSWVRHYRRTYSHVIKGGVVVNYVPDESNDTHGVRVESILETPFLPHWDVWPADTAAWGTNRSQLVGTHAQFGHGGAFQCFHHFINSAGKPWSEQGCVGTFRWDKDKSPVSDPGANVDERAARFWCQTFVELDARYNSSVPLDVLRSTTEELGRHQVEFVHWASEGPITNLLEPDFDPRDPMKTGK
jgi:hypothetical protein